MECDFNPWEELRFSDDYMFCKIMKDEKICKSVLETILNIKISKIINFIEKKEAISSSITKNVKFDIRLQDIDKIINVELQNISLGGLVKRAKSNQNIHDFENKRTFYNDKKDNYVIFICKFDPFRIGSAYYEFENVYFKHNPKLKLDDGCKKIFLNIKAKDLSKLDSNLKSLYHYLRDEKEIFAMHEESKV